MSSPLEPVPRFYPALDGLRAVAIVSVLVAHFFPDDSLLQRVFHWGRFGVLLFFVLSGFLITGLLLQGRDAIASGQTTLGRTLRAFLARRALRIAPVYYLVILTAWWVGYWPVADNILWHLTYTGNIAFAYFGAKLAQATHLWSLCVEEQFYLLWPLVVFLVKARWIVLVASALVLFSTGHEVVGTLQGRSFEQTHLVLQGCLDALGFGALLSICAHSDGSTGSRAMRLSFWAGVFGWPLLFFAQGYRYHVGPDATERLAYRLSADPGMALVSVVLVFLCVRTGPSPLRRFLELAPLRYIGRISYGIYLYHLFLIAIGREVARRYGVPEMPKGMGMFLLYGAISILVATLSWYAIEAPINRQKRRFPYPPGKTAPELPA